MTPFGLSSGARLTEGELASLVWTLTSGSLENQFVKEEAVFLQGGMCAVGFCLWTAAFLHGKTEQHVMNSS